MKLIFRYIARYKWIFMLVMLIKLMGTLAELTIPYILEYMIDSITPGGSLAPVFRWGALMFVMAFVTMAFNALANNRSVWNAHNVSYNIRQDLFEKVINLNGTDFDTAGLPSLISRMTSDSYNVQTAVQQLQSMCVRAPMMLAGGLIMTFLMDAHLALILAVMCPFLVGIAIFVSSKGIPLYHTVQSKLDDVVRIMRENITGIRVVKALSKEEYEKKRFSDASAEMTQRDIKASTIMALPGPTMQLCLNIGLVIVVILGAQRVNAGTMKPGVILAFLQYFNMITMGVMGMNRIFLSLSKAAASAGRIEKILQFNTEQTILTEEEALKPSGDEFIRFENVDFYYGGKLNIDSREKALDNISFAIKKGGSLGIIGPTGCGKTTIINLLMHFYDASNGGVFINGRDVRTYEKDELHRMFGVCFQNDMIFQDTLRENISFGRGLSDEKITNAIHDAMAAEYVDSLDEGFNYMAAIKGANLSGGQKQRILVARALAADPDILILDDSSSALDYKTDADMRKAITENHDESTLILIAQRVSSVMNMDQILVMDEGKCIGLGTHEELLESCPSYREIYNTQMGALN